MGEKEQLSIEGEIEKERKRRESSRRLFLTWSLSQGERLRHGKLF